MRSQKLRSNITRIACLLIACLMFVLAPTSETQAAISANGLGMPGVKVGSAQNNDITLASASKTGWQVYIMNTKGQIVSKIALIPGAGTDIPNGINSTYSLAQYTAKYSGEYRYEGCNADGSFGNRNGILDVSERANLGFWGAPTLSGGISQGKEIRDLIKTDEYSLYKADKRPQSEKGKQINNINYIIINYLQPLYSNMNEFKKLLIEVNQNPDDYYLILQAVAWCSAVWDVNGSPAAYTSGPVLFTSFGQGVFISNTIRDAKAGKASKEFASMSQTGNGRTGWMLNFNLPRSCALEKKWPGLPAAPSIDENKDWNGYTDGVNCYDLKTYGYGMLAFHMSGGDDDSEQTTCKETFIENKAKAGKLESLEHIAPNESENGKDKTYAIVKTYVTKTEYTDKNGKILKDENGEDLVEYKVDNLYKAKTDSVKKIKIEDESKASVEDWLGTKLKGNKDDYYSLSRWYAVVGKVIEEKNYKNILNDDKTVVRFKHLIESDNKKTIVHASTKPTTTAVNISKYKDENGKSAKTVYILLERVQKKVLQQSTCDEDYVEKYDNTLSKLPHAAPDESSNGNCTIVKTYITKTVSKDTNGVEIGATYKVDKNYLIKNDSISKIDIESETVGGKGLYKLNWYAVTSGKVISKDNFQPIKSDGSGTQFRYNIETQNGKNIVCRGDTPGTITLDKHEKNGAKGKILYVYLMREIELVNTTKNESKSSEHKAPDESEGQCAVVKCYREIDADTDEITGVATYTTKDVANAIWIENEDTPTGKVVKNNTVETVNNSKMSGYRVVAYKSTDTILNLSSLGMTGAEFAGMEDWYNKVPGKRLEGVDGTTIVDGGKKLHIKPGACLYILLEKEINGITGDFTITQSSLTKRVHLSESAATANIVTHNFRWTAPSISKTSCSGHKWSHSPGCRGGYWAGSGEDRYYVYPWCPIHTDYCSGWQWVDNSITLQLDNTKKNSYPDIIIGTNKINWQTITSYRQLNLRRDYLTRYSTGSDTKTLNNYDYAMVLWRGKDKLTVAEWKNSSSVNSLMKQIGFFVGNTPKGTRKTSEYLESFQTLFSCVSPDRNTRYTATISAPNSGGLCSVPTSTYQFNTGTQLKQSATVDVETYSGKDGGAENNKITTGNGLITKTPSVDVFFLCT